MNRIYIVEDEPLIADTIRMALEKEGYEICGEADNAADALFGIADTQPDLVLLDITLDGEATGIQLARQIQKLPGIPFIFLTSLADDDTIAQVMATHAAGYLVKPFNEKTLKANIELALHRFKEKQPKAEIVVSTDAFFVKEKSGLTRIDTHSIQFFEAFDNYAYLVTSDKKILLPHTLKSVEEKLPSGFLRVHRSYIVNLSLIESLQENILVIGRHHIPVGKSFRETLMKHLPTL
ncbi:LytR/AlgR family response regulator transcription factor [Flavobacterium caeni]|uniref:Two component transcriptional regulator, LytTR family n=1 Tax=Flavobacterium caeni TaxID=490189 RepID=A0A1G5IIM4_9FLAO|nr:response regulator [Flavobacterium caeni]SCY75409.1 two component transcriptional regulator, LytTR family [Flavobacterium caeni]